MTDEEVMKKSQDGENFNLGIKVSGLCHTWFLCYAFR